MEEKTKVCTSCDKEFPVDFFVFKNKPKGKRRSWCKNCTRAYSKKHYDNNKEDYKFKAKKYRILTRETVRDIKSESKCMLCGESRSECLVFHHLDPRTKLFCIANAIHDGYALYKVQKEIDKCVILCRNCHACIHAGTMTLK